MTGDPDIDAFLLHLDAQLSGSRSIRRPYLLEASDHLLEAKKRHMENGMPPQAAAHRAVEGCGQIAGFAAHQRADRRRTFWASAVSIWVIVGGLNALVLAAVDWPDPIRLWAAMSIPIGLLMGHFFGYLAGPASPFSAQSSQPGMHLEVAHSGLWRFAGLALLLCVVTAGLLTVGGLLGFGPLDGIPVHVALGLLCAATLLAPSGLSVMASFTIDPQGMSYRSLFRTVRISWEQLEQADAHHGFWAVLRPPLGNSKVRLAWRDSEGMVRTRVISLDRGMYNADRLLTLLGDRAERPPYAEKATT